MKSQRSEEYESDGEGMHSHRDLTSQFEEQTMIRVIAPATLKEGYSFDVMVQGRPYTIVVPPGGVKEGQEFDVPYDEENRESDGVRRHRPHDDESCASDAHEEDKEDGGDDEDEKQVLRKTTSEETSGSDDASEGPTKDDLGAPVGGPWRTSLCSCCDVVMQSTFWIACCCTPVHVAQLIARLGLTWNGTRGSADEASLAFNRIVIGMIITLFLAQIPLLGYVLVAGFFLVIVVYVGSNLRKEMRKKYKIKPTVNRPWAEKIDDCCCMCWCPCCSTIQMARHTHDDKEYPGLGCTITGLEASAPSIV